MVDQYQQQYVDEQQYNEQYQQQVQYQQQEQQQDSGNTKALNLEWVVGFNKEIDQGVHYLTDEERTEIFYTAAHTGVIYDYVAGSQKLLQGHCNQIRAVACSDNKRWVVTADAGEDSMLVVWDSLTGTPVRTYLDPHPNGVAYMDLSKDNQYIVTLGADTDQTMSLWDWTNDKEEGPICSVQFLRSETYQNQYWIKFNPDKNNEIVSNGKWRVLFHSWTTQSKKFETYSPPVELRDMPKPADYGVPYTKTVFIPGGTEMAVTGTAEGKILVWDQSVMVSGIGDHNQKRLIKIVMFTNASINVLMTVDDKYLVCGDKGGTIRFYDFKFWLVAWFENINLAEIKSLSFSKKPPLAASQNIQSDMSTKEQLQAAFRCSEFLVADSSACVMQLRPTLFEAINDTDRQKDMEVIMSGIRSHVSAVACHPEKSICAFAIGEGYLQLWDYEHKKEVFSDFQKADLSSKIQEKGPEERKGGKNPGYKRHQFYTTLCFSKQGDELMIGRSDGIISVFDPKNMEFKKLQVELKVSDSDQRKGTDAILQIVTSNCGRYFATSDTNYCVSIFKKEHLYGDKSQPMEWTFSGKMQSHQNEITGISFGEDYDEDDKLQTRLFSVGLDRRCFEYNVAEAKLYTELPVKHHFAIENEAHPTTCIWYPKGDIKEDLLLTVNDDYKMKLWNPKTMNSRRTCLGPTYGGEIKSLSLLQIPNSNGMGEPDNYLIYSTGKKVVGLIKLPLDGNPHKTMGLVAHPGDVTDICASADGKYIFTCGGDDLAVNMWSVDVTPINEEIELYGGDTTEPFVNLIEGGREGQTYQDMNDFFVYAMIRSMKEDTTKTRKLEGTVPVDQLPNLMRAMGYYPTEMEVKNMTDEVRYSVLTEEGQHKSHITREDFIKLFVNHRPVYGIGKNNILEAFQALVQEEKQGAADTENLFLFRTSLLKRLERDGEGMRVQEMENIFQLLIGSTNYNKQLPDEITAEDFAENILGFEEVEEQEQEEGEGQQ